LNPLKITHNLSIKFWIRKTQATECVTNPTIYCRITLGNQKTDFSTNFKTVPSKWNHQLCRIKDSSLESEQINSQLDELTMRTFQVVGEIKKADETLSLSGASWDVDWLEFDLESCWIPSPS
jgi:hypothetical protein